MAAEPAGAGQAHAPDPPSPQILEVGHDSDSDNDNDSAMGTLAGSDTTSLASHIANYRRENGRTYHSFKDGKYWGPNDEQAQNHLDIAHQLFLVALDGKLHLAPLPATLSNVLDVGTGTGIWAIDFADEHPEAVVVGTDLSPIQPGWVPANCKFEIDDCEADWTFPDDSFDYVHVRTMFGCVADWPRFYAQVMRVLKPGGTFEQLEYSPGAESDDDTVNLNTAMGRWAIEGIEAGEIIGKTFEVYRFMAEWVRAAGFVEVSEHKYKLPLGPWPRDKKLKEVGVWSRAHVDAGLENWCLAMLTRVLGWSYEAVMVHIAAARRDLWDKRLHGWHEMRIVYGRKPGVRDDDKELHVPPEHMGIPATKP